MRARDFSFLLLRLNCCRRMATLTGNSTTINRIFQANIDAVYRASLGGRTGCVVILMGLGIICYGQAGNGQGDGEEKSEEDCCENPDSTHS